MFRLVVMGCTRLITNQNYFGQSAPFLIQITNNLLSTTHCFVKHNHTNQLPPYNEIDYIKPMSRTDFVDFLRKRLDCSKEHATNIYQNYPEFNHGKWSHIKRIADMLEDKGVTSQSILDYPLILAQDPGNVSLSLQTLDEMKPKNINDFVPLLRASTKELVELKKTMKAEENCVPHKNRIYYLSELMKVEPSIISKALAERLFVFKSTFRTFSNKVTIMLKYMAPMDILSCPWIFKYSPTYIESKLIEAKNGNLSIIKPWMIRSPTTSARFINKLSEEKAILGDGTMVEYVASRLKLDVQTTEAILQKHPHVFKVKIVKIKDTLDYLLDEVGYKPMYIALVPRIFCHSLKTTKSRIEELKFHGIDSPTLRTVCLSNVEYKKYLNEHISWRSKEQN